VILFVHGAAGGWDELIIAAVAFAVLWIAVKLAGRKPAEGGDEDAELDEALAEAPAELETPAPPSASKSR
jgi:hypothetical protein